MAKSRRDYWIEHSDELPHGEGGHWVYSDDYDSEYNEDYEVLDDVMDQLYDSLDSSDIESWVEDNFNVSDLLNRMSNGDSYSDIENEFWECVRDNLPYIEEGSDYDAEGYRYIWVWDPPEEDEEDEESPAPSASGGAVE